MADSTGLLTNAMILVTGSAVLAGSASMHGGWTTPAWVFMILLTFGAVVLGGVGIVSGRGESDE